MFLVNSLESKHEPKVSSSSFHIKLGHLVVTHLIKGVVRQFDIQYDRNMSNIDPLNS